MKNLHNILMEVAAPQSPADKEFVALHATQKKQFVDYPESQFKGTPEKDETKLAHPSKETGHDEHVEKEKPVSEEAIEESHIFHSPVDADRMKKRLASATKGSDKKYWAVGKKPDGKYHVEHPSFSADEVKKRIADLKEETFEDLVEQNLMEISKKVLGNYIKKASAERAWTSMQMMDSQRGSKDYQQANAKNKKRTAGIHKAVDKLTKEEYEDLQELSKKTLGSYVSKANREMSLNAYSRGLRADDRREDDHVAKLQKKSDKRQSGINTALRKLTK